MLAKLIWIAGLSVTVVSVGWTKEKFVTAFIQISPDGGCQLNQKAIPCDGVPERLSAMHLSPGFSVLVVVDGAPYESVVALLDSLERNGINHVHVMPPALGTTPSKSVNHWIRFVVEGVVNHPFSDGDDLH